ncbi:DUF6119 family protein [uncultured Abiotrophia sp.]|uniref:DUF6119 family protein n=1 Tax=uncultured Abiotrophia sp. TaxID=316094 RepID=UPI0028D5EBAA|nr:DUF6119 family protein [uncultured Abiotrophia sp.]
MKITLYRSKKKYSEVIAFLSNVTDEGNNKDYLRVENELNDSIDISGIFNKDGKQSDKLKTKATLFLRQDESKFPQWLSELQTAFKVSETFEEKSVRYSSVIVIGAEVLCEGELLEEHCFVIPNGQGFREVEKIADLDFGLDFAERSIPEEKIDLKTSSFTQRNKLKTVVNYKSDQNESPQASESYFYVSGRPIQSDIFGKTIDCGMAVKFSNRYGLEEADKVITYTSLIRSVILTMKGEVITNIPRAQEVAPNSKIECELNKKLWALLSREEGTEDEYSIEYNMSRILLTGEKVTVVDNSSNLYIYYGKRGGSKLELVNYSEEQIEEYIIKKKVKSMEDIRFVLLDEHKQPISKTLKIKDLLCCELYLKDPLDDTNDQRVYLLENGRWKYFSKTFFDILEKKMDSIDRECKNYDSSFIAPKKDLIKNGVKTIKEDEYIDWFVSSDNERIKLHRILVGNGSTSVEIADIYDKRKDELIAIKMGLNTKDSMYSIEQSNISINALKNSGEFSINETLENHDITSDNITKILNCKTASILWVLKESPQYAFDGVKKGELKLGDIKSLLLKLKIIDWYSYCREHLFTPKIYLTIID